MAMLNWLWLSLAVVLLDQASKWYFENTLAPYQPVPVLPGFNWTLMYNTGAAFSLLADAGGWQRWFFLLLALGISVALVLWLYRLDRHQTWTALAIVLILGGAVGNLIDRAIYGHVIDFIQVYYDRWYWPAFNLADSAITVGAALLIIDGLLPRDRPSSQPQT